MTPVPTTTLETQTSPVGSVDRAVVTTILILLDLEIVT